VRRGLKHAVQAYQTFHGKKATRITRVGFTMPRALTYLGEGFDIGYVSKKVLHGTSKKRLYRHKFGQGVKLYRHPDGQWLLLSGAHFKITDWLRG
jgi:hypothetical protein